MSNFISSLLILFPSSFIKMMIMVAPLKIILEMK